MTAPRAILVAVTLLAASVAQAAPAPFARPVRGGPTVEETSKHLAARGYLDCKLVRLGPGAWEVTATVEIRVNDVTGRVTTRYLVVTPRDDPRAALRAFEAGDRQDLGYALAGDPLQ